MNDVVLNSVCKSYDEKAVVKGFSYSFKQGKRYCIMGESGCGKTTLLNIIMGLIPCDSGEIFGVPTSVSAVFQEDRLCEDFTPVGNLLAVCEKGRDVGEIYEILQELGLDEHKDKEVSLLSGGQKRRVAIARALFAKGDLIIMDEPFKGLDDSLKESVIQTIIRRTAGKTLVVATHDISECRMLGAELIIL